MGWEKSMPFTSINPTHSRTNPWNFHAKILRIGGAKKWGFFEASILNFLGRWILFCFISVKKSSPFIWGIFFSALWMFFPESWRRSCPNFYAHDCSRVSRKVVIYKGFYPYLRVITLPYPWWLAPKGTLPFNTLWKNLKLYPPLTLWRGRADHRVTLLKGKKSPPY